MTLTVIGSACSFLTIIGLSKSSPMGGLLYESDTDSNMNGWLVKWGGGAGRGGGNICHEEERKDFCWQFRVRDKWRKVSEDCVFFWFWGGGGGGVGRRGFSQGGFGLGRFG